MTPTSPSKTISAASRIAASNQKAKEEARQDGVTDPVPTTTPEAQAAAQAPATGGDNIQVGATVGGSRTAASLPAGVQNVKRPPGYYSRHAGKVRIGQKVWPWPMEAPLVPEDDEPELKEYLDSMVERRLAEYVKGDSEKKDTE